MKTVYKNRLPHIAPVGATFFVTFRLGDALPQIVAQCIRIELERIVEAMQEAKGDEKKHYYNEYKQCYARYDDYLDQESYGACYLKQPEVAKIVKNKLHELDGIYYDLQAYSIMPNHVHMLIDTRQQLKHPGNEMLLDIPDNYVQLDKIMHLIKGSTARYANRALGRSGVFWQKDSYDHYIRNRKEWQNILSYILNNPVKAGLRNNWEDWSHTYYKE